MRVRSALAWIACVLVAGSSVAGPTSRPMNFRQISLEDNLTQSTVTSVLQDSQGFMWFGTENGLNRYDGQRLHHYLADGRAAHRLRNDFIWDIAEDEDGNLWIATEGGGVARWRRATDDFDSWVVTTGNVRDVGGDRVRSLLVHDGKIWIGTRESGLAVLDPATSQVRRYRASDAAGALAGDAVYALHRSPDGTIWVGTDRGLSRYDPRSDTFQSYRAGANHGPGLSDQRVLALHQDPNGVMWIGTYGGGVNRLDPESGHISVLRHSPSNPASLSDDEVRAILRDSRGRLWVGTSRGLNLLTPDGTGFTRYLRDRSDPTSLSNDAIMSLHEDDAGQLWIGTRAGGVNRWNPRGWLFGHHAGGLLADTNVTAFADDGTQTIWIGTMGQGLLRLNRHTGNLERYAAIGSDNSIGDDRVMSLLLDHKGDLWVGTMDAGLSRISTASGRIRRFRNLPADTHSLSADGVMSLYEDSAGDVWIGTFNGGINRWRRDADSLERFAAASPDEDSLGTARATAITEDRQGTVWVGTDGDGLYAFDRGAGRFTRYIHERADAGSISSNSIYAMTIDPTGTLWIATSGDGLNRLVSSRPSGTQARFAMARGFPAQAAQSFYGIQATQTGELWLSTNHGIIRYDPSRQHTRTYRHSDGLQGEEFNFGAHHQAPDGRIYFGGANGFNAFYPEQIEHNDRAPQLVLSSYEIMNRPASDGLPHYSRSAIDLDYRDNLLTLELAALDYTAPERNQFRYRLAGFNDEWVTAGAVPRVSYTNLPGGNYVFEAEAANSDGIWSEAGLRLPIRVELAPWQTKWALLSYLIAFLLLVFALWKDYRAKQAADIAYRVRLEREVEERTAQIANQNERLRQLSDAKSDFLARMSHEVRTPLNGVIGMSELLLGTTLDAAQKRFTGTIRKSAEALLAILNDILDVSKIEAGKVSLDPTSFNICAILEETIDLLYGRASAKGIQLVCAAPPLRHQPLIGDALKLRQILTNLIGNAIKFTASGEVVVRCQIQSADSSSVRLRCEVSDTGPGIRPENLEKIFEPFAQEDASTTRRFGGTGLGLSISKELVELMGGSIGVASEAGVGSTFWFCVELAKAPEEAASWLAAGRGQRVLVAVPALTLRTVLVDQLHVLGFQAEMAHDAAEVRTKLGYGEGTQSPDYAVLLIDDQALALDTTELARLLAASDRPLPATLLLCEPGHCADMPDTSGFVRLQKPVRQSELYDALASVLGVQAMSPEEPASAGKATPGSAVRRVLVVEDNPVNQAVARGMLERLGCSVEVAADGREAVARAAGSDFDLIMMDCEMPQMDGYAATVNIRNVQMATRRVPIVAVTANALGQDRERCLRAGMDDYLSKPFSLAQLEAVLVRWTGELPAAVEPVKLRPLPEHASIDVAALRAIEDLDTAVTGILQRVIELYVGGSEELVQEISDGWERRDSEAMRRAAHALKSSSANVGAVGIAALCTELESLAAGGELDAARSPLSFLIASHPGVVQSLRTYTREKAA